jgi:hypothetical protein
MKTPKAKLEKNERYRKANWDKVYARQLEWQRENKDRCNAANRKARKKLRQEVLAAYGGQCDCCGEKEEAFLEIDHIQGGGNKHRAELGGNAKLYPFLRANNFPSEFRLLCCNCNKALAKLGFCPHELERVAYA